MINLFGGDFEFHITDEDGNAVMAEPILGINKNAYISSDVGAAEIRPYSSNSKTEFLSTTREMLKELYDKSREKLIISPAVFITNNTYSIPDETYPDGLVDMKKSTDQFNAWYKGKISRTFIDNHIRTQGAHLWLEKPILMEEDEFVKVLDLFLAIPMVYVFRLPGEVIRRRKYGMAGSYRTNRELIEYRTLSSSIMRHPIILTEMLNIIDLIWEEEEKFSNLLTVVSYKYDLQSIINNCDSFTALECIQFLTAMARKVSCPRVCVQIDRYLAMIEYVRNLPSLRETNSLMVKEIKEAWMI